MSKPLHVLLLNGSPRANGNTSIALKELENIFHTQGVETETVLLGNQDIRGCIACYSCKKTENAFSMISSTNWLQNLKPPMGWLSQVRSTLLPQMLL